MGSDIIANGGGYTGEGGTLASGGVDDDKRSIGHEQKLELVDGLAMTCSSSTVDARGGMDDMDKTGV